MKEELYDCVIVGGGPAGLSAALILGRCMRTVAVLDNGCPRNIWSRNLHAFLTRDNIPPEEFLRLAREDLRPYESVKLFSTEIVSVRRESEIFILSDSAQKQWKGRTLLLATGVIDEIPNITGIMEFYGKTVHNCPYCDGWEMRNKALAAYGKHERGFSQAFPLLKWSKDLILFTDGTSLTKSQKDMLAEKKITFREEKITRLTGINGNLEFIELENGEKIPREAMFFNTESYLRSKLLEQLGCPFTNEDGVLAYKYERTKVPGLFVAGNILREVQLVVVAAAQGAEAAFGINKLLNQLVP